MNLTLDAELKKKCPRAALGLVIADVSNTETCPALDEALKAAEAHVLALPEPRAVLESSEILATRSGYKALGKDPARYRGSAEALLRRVISGKNLPRISTVVDIINLVSVESRFSIGFYDLSKVMGDVCFRTGRAGESYKGIGKYDLNLEGLPLFSDAEGPHGSPTSDSERTMVTLETRRVAAILISFNGVEKLEKWSARLAELLREHASGTGITISTVS